MCSDLLAENTSRAAAFSTDCNRFIAGSQTRQLTLNYSSQSY